MAFGRMASNWRQRNWPQISISSGSGVRFPGGRHFDHVADVDVVARVIGMPSFARGAFDHLSQQLAGPSDEGEALRVFIRAGAFPHENQVGLLVAGAEDDLVALFVQPAAAAIADIGRDADRRVSAFRGEGRAARGSGPFGSMQTAGAKACPAVEGLNAEVLVKSEYWRRSSRFIGRR